MSVGFICPFFSKEISSTEFQWDVGKIPDEWFANTTLIHANLTIGKLIVIVVKALDQQKMNSISIYMPERSNMITFYF